MNIKIGAILYGVGEGITDINIKQSMFIEKASIYDNKIIEFFDKLPLDMLKIYSDAINVKTGEFYWIRAEFKIEKSCYVKKQTDLEYLTLVDKQIRMLRLLIGRYIYVKDFRYTIVHDKIYRTISNFPSPDLATEYITHSKINLCNVKDIEKLIMTNLPFDNQWIYNVFLVYEKSYSKDLEISFITIMTALEMIFLNNDKNIKENLSQRISVYLSKEENQIKETYNRIRQLYKKRSCFVHEGKNNNISMDEINYMREIVRSVIITFMKTDKTKKDFCNELINDVLKWYK